LTPPSYSRRTLMQFRRYRTTMPTMMIGTEIMGTSLFSIKPDLPAPSESRSGLSSHLVNPDLESIQDPDHPHLAPFGDGFSGLGIPELAVDENFALGAEVGLGGSDLPDQPFLPCKGFSGMSPEHQKHKE